MKKFKEDSKADIAMDKKQAKKAKIPMSKFEDSAMDVDAMKKGGKVCMKKGGKVKKYAKGGGVEIKGKTKGKLV